MRDLKRILLQLDELVAANPDPIWETTNISQIIASFNPDSGQLSDLIERYGGSEAPAVVGALAAYLVDDAKQPQPNVGLHEVLRLACLMTVRHPNLLALCLEATSRRIGCDQSLVASSDAQQLQDFILECLSFSGEGSFLVEIGVLDVLEKLQDAGFSAHFFEAGHLAEVREWLSDYQEREGNSAFGKQARELLESLQG